MKYVLFPVAVLAAHVAQAEPVADPMDDGLCARIVAAVQDVVPARVTFGAVAAEGEACVLRDALVDMPGLRDPDFGLERIHFSARGVEAFLAQGTPLQAVDLRVDNLRILPRTGDAFYDYMFEVQQARNTIDLDLNVAWDPETLVLSLDRFFIDFQGDNSVLVTQRLAGVDLVSVAALEASIGQIRVTDMMVEVETNGLFEGYLFAMILPLIQSVGGDPRSAVAALQDQGIAAVGALPSAMFDAQSRAALTALVQDMPQPGGTVSARLTADPGIGALQMGAVAMERRIETALQLFEGVQIEVRYDRVPIE